MIRRKKTALAVILLVGGGIASLLFGPRPAPQQSGPLHHEVYVWQRAWTEPVRDAVRQHGTNFQRLVLLAAEVTWNGKQPRFVRVPIDYSTVRQTGIPAGLALRIGAYSGPFTADDGASRFLVGMAASLINEAQTNRMKPVELQIDFDCAESKLAGYQVWLEAIKRKVAPVPVTITALPSWLNAGAFPSLAHAASNYVLQVHSVERPASFDAPFSLCNTQAAVRAVERAARIGVPFRVALPTYGYVFAFDPAGGFIGLSAEGQGRDWPEGTRVREVHSNPIQMAALVRGWVTRRPAAMTGVIWYRLPTIVDNLNWRWPTLGAIIKSHSLRESLRIKSRQVEPGLIEFSLVNDGELDTSSRLAVQVGWSNARLVAGDGLGGFTLVDNGPSTAQFQTQSQPCRLPAGETLKVGWLRFDQDCEVKCELKKL